MHPVIFRTVNLRQDKRKGRQHRGDHQVRRSRRAEGDQAQQVADEDEEEDRQQVGQKLSVMVLAEVGLGYVVADEDDERLEEILEEALRRRLEPDAALVAPGQAQEDDQHDGRAQQRKDKMAREREVDDDAAGGGHEVCVEVRAAGDKVFDAGGCLFFFALGFFKLGHILPRA